MAADPADFLDRLKRLLPSRWFGDGTDTPVLDAVLAGGATCWTWLRDGISDVRLQTRLATATGEGLDFLAYDFLGERIRRRDGETDAAFRLRVRREILRPKSTRQAVSDAVEELTGYVPLIFEPGRPADTGSWNAGGAAYGVAGGYGSRLTPYQCFVRARRPHGVAFPIVSGFDETGGGLGVGRLKFLSPEEADPGVSDDDIREAILSSIALGTVVWLSVEDPPLEGVRWDVDGFWDTSRWG